MIVTRIYGGLGNQLFQYSFARALSIKYNRKLFIDKSYYNRSYVRSDFQYGHRTYKLDLYNIKYDLCPESISQIGQILSRKKIYYLTNYLFKYTSHLPTIIKENNYSNSAIKSAKVIYLNDYWQFYSIINEYREYLLKELTLKNSNFVGETNKLYNNILNSESVAIHFRRGDYIENPTFSDVYFQLKENYYKKAILKIIDQVGAKKIKLFIFSDNIEWVEKNTNFNNDHVFVNKMVHDYISLFLMSSCKHNIIANSSFSWWGAWLNKNPNKIVIAPKNWFTSKNRKNDIYFPKVWNVITNV